LRLWRSIKYEVIYLKNYATLPELLLGLAEYFVLSNSERHHQTLGYTTPDYVYSTGKEKEEQQFLITLVKKQEPSSEEMGQCQSAAIALVPS